MHALDGLTERDRLMRTTICRNRLADCQARLGKLEGLMKIAPGKEAAKLQKEIEELRLKQARLELAKDTLAAEGFARQLERAKLAWLLEENPSRAQGKKRAYLELFRMAEQQCKGTKMRALLEAFRP